ncbi:hypothetical protein [Sphingobium sp.]|uniref:hypothetical protein n=1 Tax=Sphingobium sp. TaxID=1912891 RepID=UPI0028BF311E|nr:hypothetical protein [Sphingobium sp.]
MHDHLKDAANASDLSDGQLFTIRRRISDRKNLTGFEQAVLDEMERRHLTPGAVTSSPFPQAGGV